MYPSHVSQVCKIEGWLRVLAQVRVPVCQSSCVSFGDLINISEPWVFSFCKMDIIIVCDSQVVGQVVCEKCA